MNQTAEKWLFDTVSESLGWFMENIKNSLEDVREWTKETLWIEKKTNLDLSKLLDTINNKEESKKNLEKSKEFSSSLKYIKRQFWEEIYKKEVEFILSLFKYWEFSSEWVLDRLNEDKDLKITENQSKFILWILEKDQEYIKNNKSSISPIIKEIGWEKNIHDIVKAHKKLKTDNLEINTTSVKRKIEEDNLIKSAEWNDLDIWWNDDEETDDEV